MKTVDIEKIQKAKKRGDDTIIGQCPACAANGGDSKGDHLIVYPDGRYGCVANPENTTHRAQILSLIGLEGLPRSTGGVRVSVRRYTAPAKKKLLGHSFAK